MLTEAERNLWHDKGTQLLARARANVGKPCDICNGLESVIAAGAVTTCPCVLARMEAEEAEQYRRYTQFNPDDRGRRYDQLKPVGGGNWRPVERAIAGLQVLELKPHYSKWMVICGKPGCGKSHLLLSAYNLLEPYAIYQDVGALSAKLRQGLNRSDEKNENWMSTDDMVDLLAQVPVLFLDDLGVENPNSEFIATALTDIVARRYQMGKRRPTVVATNLSPDNLLSRYPRMGSRLLDHQLTEVYAIPLGDYRTKHMTKVK